MALPSRKKKDAITFYQEHWEPALIEYFRSAKALHKLPESLRFLGHRLYDFKLIAPFEISCQMNDDGEEGEVFIGVQGGKIFSECTCGEEFSCEHGLALALVLAANAQKAGHKFPSSLLKTYARAFALLSETALEIPGLEEIVGKGPTEAEPLTERWWEVIVSNGPWPQQEEVLRDVVKRRLKGFSFWDVNNVISAVREIRNPVKRLRQLDKAIDNVRFRYSNRPAAGREVDQELEEYLASEEAARLETEYERMVAQEDLLEWLQKARMASDIAHRRDRLELFWLPIPIDNNFFWLGFQLHAEAGQRGLVARKANGISLISRDVVNGNRDFGPLRNQMVTWINDTQLMNPHAFSGLETADETVILVRNVYQWLTLWSQCLRWADGGRISLAPWMGELTLSSRGDGDPNWVIRLPAHDGQEADEILFSKAMIYIDALNEDNASNETGYNYYIRVGDALARVETHRMSPSVLKAIQTLGKVPLDALKGTPAGAALLRMLEEGHNPDVDQWIKEVPVKVEVDLGASESGQLMVSGRAIAEDGQLFCWKPESGWKKLENTSEGNEALGELIEADLNDQAEVQENTTDKAETEAARLKTRFLHERPRRRDVLPVEQWLDQISLSVGNLTVEADSCSFSGRLQLDSFLHLWFSRPPSVKYYGNTELRRLITVRSAPRLSVKSELTDMDWLKVSVALEDEISQTTLVEMSRILAANTASFVRLPDGSLYRRSDLEDYQNQVSHLNALGLSLTPGDQNLHALHLAGAPAGALLRLESGGGAFAALAKKSRQLLEDFSGIPEASVPDATAQFLRPYQRAGVDFLSWAAVNFGGALLADDMGLGKTLQMLATMAALRMRVELGDTGPSLVVCPASVARNWEREAHRFVPGMKVMVLESGAGRKKHLAELDKYDLVILNYALLRRDVESLKKVKWFAIVADEAQAIKNPVSESSRALKQLQGRYRFALTGTPIENRIADLYSIVEFALPGYLGEMDKDMGSTDPAAAARASQLLRARLRPVLMRRLKVEVAPELPDRVETRIDCEMGSTQKKLYAAEVKRVRLMLDGMETNGVRGKERIQILAALMRLRQICCDPMLLGHPEIPSGKTEELVELVPPLLEAGHKVLIFSQFVKMLNHLEEQLTGKGIRTYMLTGATKNRQELVDEFENDPEPAAFLISLKAGGTGLNLVSASHVILFDPWWNPSVEAQAIDRTHRIGQDKTVVAYRLVTAGTIEERILELQERKRALVKDVLEEEAFNRTLSGEDFEFLLG